MIKTLFRALLRPFRHRAIARLPSRRFIIETLIPALATAGCQRMLLVGVQSYNVPLYEACARAGITVWSIDYDPASSAYAAPAGHFVGDIRKVDALVQALCFEVILFNGVLGFGINTASAALDALTAMAKVAAPAALLVVGWNPGRTDNAEIEALRPRLRPVSLPDIPAPVEFAPRGRAQRDPHRYEIFTFGGAT